MNKIIIIFPNDPSDKRKKNIKLVNDAIDFLDNDIKDIHLNVVYGQNYKILMENMKASDMLIFTSLYQMPSLISLEMYNLTINYI